MLQLRGILGAAYLKIIRIQLIKNYNSKVEVDPRILGYSKSCFDDQ